MSATDVFPLSYRLELQVELFLHDCGGHELFRETMRQHWANAHAAIIVVDLTDKAALQSCEQWLSDVRKAASRNIPAVLVGTKADDEERRAIASADLQSVATRLQCSCFECSALPPGRNIDEPFQKVAQMFADAYEEHLQAHSASL